MPLLKRATLRLATAALALAAGLGACDDRGRQGHYQLQLHDRPVECTPELGVCRADERAAPGEALRGVLYASSAASRYRDQGLYLYAELSRATGRTAILELDLPTGPTGGQLRPQLLYVEYDDQREVFRSTEVRGQIQLPPPDDCECTDGRFELVFAAPGADGKLGTPDDDVRRLSQGQLSSTGHYCRGGQILPVGEGLQLLQLRCPSGAAPRVESLPAARRSDTRSDGSTRVDVGCALEPEESAPSGGCDGGDPPHEAEGGCASDGGEAQGCDSGGGEARGCEGDGGDACVNEARAAVPHRSSRGLRRARRGALHVPREVGLPTILLALLIAQRVERRRFRPRRGKEPGVRGSPPRSPSPLAARSPGESAPAAPDVGRCVPPGQVQCEAATRARSRPQR